MKTDDEKNQLNSISSLRFSLQKNCHFIEIQTLYRSVYEKQKNVLLRKINNSRHIRFMKSSDLSNIMLKKTDSGLVSIIVLISFHDNLS